MITNINTCGLLFLVGVWLTSGGACAAVPNIGVTPIKPASVGELRNILLHQTAVVERFRLRGPYAVTVRENHEIRLSPKERIKTDLYLSAHGEVAPLVIILHGYDCTKENHRYQATHLASWGMHSLSVQLPRRGSLLTNGKTLARIVSLINRQPEIIDARIDVTRIVLTGHSFGGASVTVALADGARALGGILLDPATNRQDLIPYLRKVKKPVMMLGADETQFMARNRDYFFRYVPGGMFEVSIRGAIHEDAQFPSSLAGVTEALQITYSSALASAAFSLAYADGFDYVWKSFGDVSGTSRFIKSKKK